MKGRKVDPAVIFALLKEHEAGLPAAEICRRLGVADNTFYRWKSKYGGLELAEAQRLQELELENGKLKRIVADLLLENNAIKEVLGKKW